MEKSSSLFGFRFMALEFRGKILMGLFLAFRTRIEPVGIVEIFPSFFIKRFMVVICLVRE